MMAPTSPIVVVAVPSALLVVVLLYDLRGATQKKIAGEAPLRWRRAAATVVALGALLAFQRLVARLNPLGWGALAIFALACVTIFGYSRPLKRLVLANRPERRPGAGVG
jgi:hypothetical protein